MNITEKYTAARPQIKAGMLILFRGTSIISKLIQHITGSYFNHVGVVFAANGRLFIMDANAPGVHPELLSARVAKYEDFACIDLCQSEEAVNTALGTLMDKDSAGVKYNFPRLLMIAIKDRFGIDAPAIDGTGRVICSQYAQEFCNLFPIPCYQKDSEMIPQGFITEADSSVKILFN
jgi:hypothetical protein